MRHADCVAALEIVLVEAALEELLPMPSLSRLEAWNVPKIADLLGQVRDSRNMVVEGVEDLGQIALDNRPDLAERRLDIGADVQETQARFAIEVELRHQIFPLAAIAMRTSVAVHGDNCLEVSRSQVSK